MTEPPDEPVPKLPRGRGIKLSGPELFRIALTLIALIGVIVLTKPCANSVSGFVTSFDRGSDTPMPKPGTVDLPKEQHFERLKPGMTEAEIKAAMERSKAANATSAANSTGSAANSTGSAAAAGSTGSAANSTGSAAAAGSAGSAGSAAISGSGTSAPRPAKP